MRLQLSSQRFEIQPSLQLPPAQLFDEQAANTHMEALANVALAFANGHEKIRANATRALGNAASSRQIALDKPEIMQSLVQTIIQNGQSKTFKIQWNAFYALSKVIAGNGVEAMQQKQWYHAALQLLVGALAGAVNFKVLSELILLDTA